MGPLALEEGDDERSVMQKVATMLEPMVRRFPEQWFPFRQFYADGDGGAGA
jgi:lauroyl/myristoyl acyltransferase